LYSWVAHSLICPIRSGYPCKLAAGRPQAVQGNSSSFLINSTLFPVRWETWDPVWLTSSRCRPTNHLIIFSWESA